MERRGWEAPFFFFTGVQVTSQLMDISALASWLCCKLERFGAVLAGSFPLGLQRPDSDIDIICSFSQIKEFEEALRQLFGHYQNFQLAVKNIRSERCVVCKFVANGTDVEIFGQNKAVHQQYAWRHLVVEQRLLEAGGESFRKLVAEQRESGSKTEVAFATVLGLSGDPFEALLLLEVLSVDQLESRFFSTQKPA